MKVICISGKAMAGKDTTAIFLREFLESNGYRVRIAHFADQLKHICTDWFDWDSKKDEKGRSLLQYVGTDVVRTKSPDFWVNSIVSILNFFPNEWDYVIIPDCRFPSEYEIFQAFGLDAILLRVERPNFQSPLTAEQQAHPSETALDDYKYDYKIINDGTLKDLKDIIKWVAPSLLGRKIMEPLTILFDADDTLEDLCGCWCEFLNRHHNTNVSPEDVTDWNISQFFPTVDRKLIYDALSSPDLWHELKPIPGAVETLTKLHEDGHQLYMVTATDYRTPPAKFERIFELLPWLDRRHIIMTANKQMVRGDILIDDGPHNLVGGEHTKLLFDRPHNRNFDAKANGVIRVYTWEEIYEAVQICAKQKQSIIGGELLW